MKITDNDKNQIQLIDEQVVLLQAKQACDEAIIDALTDFIPDVVCLVQNTDKHILQTYFDAYGGFAYFISIIHLALKEES